MKRIGGIVWIFRIVWNVALVRSGAVLGLVNLDFLDAALSRFFSLAAERTRRAVSLLCGERECYDERFF